MPTEEEALRALAYEILTRTPPLNNLRFTNRYVASFLGSAILDWAADTERLAGMDEMGVDEATNQIGALLAHVSFFFAFSFQVFCFAWETLFFEQVSSMILYISNSHSSEQAERVVANEEWRATNEPCLAALDIKVADQTSHLELATSKKLQMVSEVADLKEKLIKAEEKVVELWSANDYLNKARDEAIAPRHSIQEELKYDKLDDF